MQQLTLKSWSWVVETVQHASNLRVESRPNSRAIHLTGPGSSKSL